MYQVRFAFLAIVALLVLNGCKLPDWPSVDRTPVAIDHVYIPYIESIDIPATAHVGETVECKVQLSTAQNAVILTGGDYYAYNVNFSPEYSNGVDNGTYHTGEFHGMVLTKASNHLEPSSVFTMLLQFQSPGEKYLYFGHIANQAHGGQLVQYNPEVELFTMEYPTGSQYEMLEVKIDILP